MTKLLELNIATGLAFVGLLSLSLAACSRIEQNPGPTPMVYGQGAPPATEGSTPTRAAPARPTAVRAAPGPLPSVAPTQSVVPAVQQAAMMAAQMCQQGNPRACGPAQWFTQYSTGLAQDFQTCQRGFQPACASYSQRALQAQEGIQQFMNTFVEGQGTQP